MAGALREVFARFGVEVDDKKLDALNAKVGKGASGLMRFGSVLAGALGAGALFKFASHISEVGDEIAKNAIRVGISGERLQALGFAAGQSGASVDGLKIALLSLSDRMADAGQGGKETAEQFGRLGIHVKDAAGHLRGSDEVMLDAADAISKMSSPTEQAAAAMKVFGRQGRELLPFLKEGREGITKLTDEARELGGGFSGEALKASEEYNDALGRMGFAISSVQGKIAKALLPVLQKAVDGVTKGVAWFAKLAKQTRAVETALAALGTILAGFALRAAVAMSPIIAPFVLWGAVLGGIALVLEDIYTWFKGGKSVIGDWLNSLLGVGKARDVLFEVRAIVRDISLFMHKVVEDIGAMMDALGNRTESKAFQNYKRFAVQQGAHFIGGDEAERPRIIARRGTGPQIGDFGKPGAAGDVETRNSVNVVVNAGNADAKETARLVREEVKRVIAAGNKVAAVSVTREAPAE